MRTAELAAQLMSDDANRRIAAMLEIRQSRRCPKALVRPLLQAFLRGQPHDTTSFQALRSQGTLALRALLLMLRSADAAERAGAAAAMVHLVALPHEERNPWRRWRLRRALRRLATPALTAALADSEAQVRLRAAVALSLGVALPYQSLRVTMSMLDALVLRTEDTDLDVQRNAIIALGMTGVRSEAVLAAFRCGLESPDVGVRQVSADALGIPGPLSRAAPE